MKIKYLLNIIVPMLLCMALLSGCGNSASIYSEDLSHVQFDINTISFPDNVKVVGLGEASHGVKEYHQMKAGVFKALVENNGCRTFIIEGDFGGALKVDEYIQGGAGTAEDIVGEIGFAVYRTQEMVDFIDWMRSYNARAPVEGKLHFYGMDMQRYDNNKEYLFSILDETDSILSEKYKDVFSQLTDENRTSLDESILNKGKENALRLQKDMEAIQTNIVKKSGQYAFDFAKECLNTIYECCDVQLADNKSYNATRDKYMSEKIKWYLQHGDGSILFVNGHNGHIGKTSVADYTCLGELLNENMGEYYYSIGTDAEKTKFNSQNNDGEFDVVEVRNTNGLNKQFNHIEERFYLIDFSKISTNNKWKQIVNSKQKITTLNVGLSDFQKMIKSFYTTTIIPNETFDGMIVFQQVSPTTIIE